MDTVQPHDHDFPKSDWSFAEPENVAAISTVQVFRQEYPILLVSHDDDGAWQILCGTTSDPKDGIVVCLGCVYQKDKTIAEVADLPPGWTAWRDHLGDPWHCEQKAAEEDDA